MANDDEGKQDETKGNEEENQEDESKIDNDEADKTTKPMPNIYEEIIEPTMLWLSLDDDMLKDIDAFRKQEIFDEAADSAHNLAAKGHKIMRIDAGLIGETERWLKVFEESFDEKGSYFKTKKAETMRKFAIRLAKSNPIEIFDEGLWDKGELRSTNVTNPWMAAYALLGATWTKEKTFKDFFDNYEDDKVGS